MCVCVCVCVGDSVFFQSVPLHEQDPAQYYPPVPGTLSPLGEVEVSRDSTVDELKSMILTLPQVIHLSSLKKSYLSLLASRKTGL